MAGKALSGDSAAGKPKQSQKGKQAREAAPGDDSSEPAPADDGTVSADEATEELERIGADAVAYYDANGSYDGLTDSDLSSSLPLRLVEGPCDEDLPFASAAAEGFLAWSLSVRRATTSSPRSAMRARKGPTGWSKP